MVVAELVEILARMPQDAEVKLISDDDFGSSVIDAEIVTHHDGWVVIE